MEDKEQIGTLFQIKGKFTLNKFSNITFLETDNKSEYQTLIKKIQENLIVS